jgi:ribosome-associated protein
MENPNDLQSSQAVTVDQIIHEIVFTSSRSGGPGGQNVNKVNTKVTIRFDIPGSRVLSDDVKTYLLRKLSGKLTTEGVLVIASQSKRSQLDNKNEVLGKLEEIFRKAFEKKKPRKKTRPGKAAKEKRIESKKKNAEKKKWRQKL